MAESQRHGFDFENWIKRTFFAEGYVSYSHKWDVPRELNTLEIVPTEYRNLPVSVKTCKSTGDLGFGDALRQYQMSEDFVLIVGFWEQDGDYKNFTSVEAAKITVTQWRDLFSPLTFEQIVKFDRYIKDKTILHTTVQKRAKQIKKLDEYLNAKIILNPKIDSKGQRRLQCTVPSKIFWSDFVGKEKYSRLDSSLWGVSVPNPFLSGSRKFNPKQVV